MSEINSPVKIGTIILKNRITMAPTVKFDYTDDAATVTDKHIEHYGLRAKGGTGLICVEATAVLPEGRFWRNHMGLWSDEFIDGHKKITDACHNYEVPVIIQLNHAGFFASKEFGQLIGPSDMEFKDNWNPETLSVKGLTVEGIHKIQDAYVSAAIRAKASNYDGIQLHGCHRYLINQFVSPAINKRSDNYGGSIENRARFASEIIARIRKECGDDFLISVRTTGCDPTIEDAIKIAEEYVKAGCNYLQVSTGFTDIGNLKVVGDLKELCPTLGVEFHKHFQGRIPVSCVGGIKTAEEVKYLLENDLVDTVDLGRPVLADPDFAKKAVEHKYSEIKKCLNCRACQYGPFTNHKCPFGNV